MAVLETFIGISLGALAGWRGRLTDSFIMRIVDVFLGIPYLVLAFAFIAVIGEGVGAVIITLALTSWLTDGPRGAGRVPAGQAVRVRRGGPGGRRAGDRGSVAPHPAQRVQPIIVLVAVGHRFARCWPRPRCASWAWACRSPTPSLGPHDLRRAQSYFSTAPHLLFFPAWPSS